MDATTVVLDISSDEEEKGSDVRLKNFDYDWIREFLGMSDDDEKSDDSDEVVIIHENKPQPKPKSSTVAVKAVKDVDDGDGDDDDCVVLDGDPENGDVTCVDDDDQANGSDEVLVVGVKGQIACRDYPHARHLCAKFPFSSTPHATHCDQCHCYVCDSLAPCLMWGSGLLSSDHCNANDKIEMWKIWRKNFKEGNSSPLPVSIGTSLPVGHCQRNEIPPLDIIHLPPDSMLRNQASRSTAMHTLTSINSIPQNQASRPTRMFALSPSLNSGVHNLVPRSNNSPVYSAAPNLTIPNGANHGRCQQTGGSTLVRNRSRPHPVARQWLGVRRHAIPRGNGGSHLGPQLLRSQTMPNRLASAGDAMSVNHSSHVSSGFSNHGNPVPQINKYHTATGFSNDRNCNNPDQVWLPGDLPLYPNQSSESQAYIQPLSQSNYSHDPYQSCIQGSNDAPSSFVACLNGNQLGSQQQIGNQNENASRNITQCGITGQETNQPKPQEKIPSKTARRDDIPAFDSTWTENSSQSIQPLVACSHLQGSGSTNQTPNVNDIEAGVHITADGSTGTPIESSHVPSSLNDFENWFLDEDLFERVSDGDLPSELNIPSPDFAPVDSGIFLSEW